MLTTPLFKNISQKSYNLLLWCLIIIMYVCVCAEADIYVPAFPQMIDFFGVKENQIQLILSLNFISLCVTGLIAGPLSDSYGRRPVLLAGLMIFVISSLGCVMTDDFTTMLFWRFLQGGAASFPMVIGTAIMVDRYPPEIMGKNISLLNSVIAACIAGAPLVGAWICEYFSWRANFIVILFLGAITFIGTFFWIEESLAEVNRKKFRIGILVHDYRAIVKNIDFMCYTLIASFPFAAIVVYISNIPVIFMNNFGMALDIFSYYQATTMLSFLIFSLISAALISRKGIKFTQDCGLLLSLGGVLGLLYTSHFYPNQAALICLFMGVLAAGGAMLPGTFGIKALSLFPEMSGTALAMMTTLRQLVTAGLVILSEIIFDRSIVPVAHLITGYGIVALGCYGLVHLNNSKKINLSNNSHPDIQ